MSSYTPPGRHDSDPTLGHDRDFKNFADFGGPVQPPQDCERRLLSASDVAKYCGVPHEEVLNWIDTGRLVANYMRHGGYRIAIGDFMAFFSRYVFLI